MVTLEDLQQEIEIINNIRLKYVSIRNNPHVDVEQALYLIDQELKKALRKQDVERSYHALRGLRGIGDYYHNKENP